MKHMNIKWLLRFAFWTSKSWTGPSDPSILPLQIVHLSSLLKYTVMFIGVYLSPRKSRKLLSPKIGPAVKCSSETEIHDFLSGWQRMFLSGILDAIRWDWAIEIIIRAEDVLMINIWIEIKTFYVLFNLCLLENKQIPKTINICDS